jgi:uncharacterized RDD family membrane protein YckC
MFDIDGFVADTHGMKKETSPQYADFLERFVAYLIDNLFLSILTSVVMIPFVVIVFAILGVANSSDSTGLIILGLLLVTMLAILISVALNWWYNAYFEASKWQGTPGKRIMNIAVVDLSGNRVTLKMSSVRFLVKWVTSSFSLVYIVMLFNKQFQNLHDMAAETLVIKRS